MTTAKKRLLIVAIICFVIIIMLFPIETTVVPKWKLQVVDVNGTACANMRVTQSWGHYSLYTDGNNSSDNRPTDTSGYVQFPERTIRASMPRRLIMPIITRILTIMHGGGGVDGAVWASGTKDVAWLSYKGGKSLPDKMRVEKCISDGTEQSLAADGAIACFSSSSYSFSVKADRAPQLKASVGQLPELWSIHFLLLNTNTMMRSWSVIRWVHNEN